MKSPIPKSIVALFLAAPFGLVYSTVFIIIPDGPLYLGAFPRLIHGALPVLSVALGAVLYRAALSAPSTRRFVTTAVPTVVLLTALAVLSGTRLHRDFYSAAFQYILTAPAVLLAFFVAGNGANGRTERSTLIALSRGGVVLSVLYAQWIILMGCAIAVRLEPRPLQAMVYNLYNLALVLLLFFLSRAAGNSAYRTLLIRHRQAYADGKDLALLVGDRKAALIALFALAPDLTLRCPELQALSEGVLPEADRDRCDACSEREAKATLCPKYRNTYNSILEIKKALEFLEIGTITAPDNKRKVLEQGWKLRLFRNARIVAH